MAMTILVLFVLAAGVAGEYDAMVVDDACLAGQGGEECALALRQLRGRQHLQEVSRHGHEAGLAHNASDNEGGFCCYSGASAKDMCGTCYPTAKAAEGSFCAGKSKCGGCGGTWCTAQCVFSGSDPSDVCGSAYDTAIASAGDFCSKSESACSGCKGTWCAVPASIPKEDEDDSKKEDDSKAASTPSTAAPSTDGMPDDSASAPTNGSASLLAGDFEADDAEGGFCCYSGASAKDMCGTCYPTAKAAEGSFCAGKSKCGGCGGTWCTAQCVFSGSDPSDVCGSAYDTAIASAGDFCSKSESACSGCKGTWCAVPASIPKEDEDDSKKEDKSKAA
eukprot:CAMPEP_0115277196 /NCGR_PEP_ID=MMETSP0270-20121206/57111_1 /TAXON_ID=71861 /ORGANISM="Scrippsiella trochoidea, Strain CCMP3099" /LENGTH=333 /DNA_ID=CAMNT_0002693821 /DNA_START=88 /DNA_END=1085 /DNA_ORIENTATION=-